MSRKNKDKKKILFGPILTMLILTFIIMLVSAILSLIGFEGQKTAIVNGTLETSLITIKNIFTIDGLKFVIGNAATNFKVFEPLVILIISLIGVGIADASGLIKAIASPFRKFKIKYIILVTIFIGIISTFLGEYSYIILLPLVAAIYKYLDRNPILGILTIFIGITLGYGTGIIYNYDDYLLGGLTELAAKIDVDKNYKFVLTSNIYIMIVSSILLSFVGASLIEKVLIPKISKYKNNDEDENVISKKALYFSNFTLIALLIGFMYMIVPGFYGSGVLIDKEQGSYIAKLFSDTSPLKDGLPYVVMLILMVCSLVYGKISGNLKNSNEYSLGLSKSFEGLGYVFVLMFFLAQMIGILNWTNLGEVIATRLIDFMSTLQFSGIPLIITLFIVVVFISILIPATLTKWILMSPIIVPLFMRSNITPDFTQFIFKVADGIGKSFTPLFVYFIIMLGFMQKYNNDDDYKITIFGTMRLILPIILMIFGLWILIVLGWYIIGLPTGTGTFPTL
jgi:aminobenzoyl-glutamate transport protein